MTVRSLSLRRRIVGAYLLLAIAVSALFSVVIARSLLSIQDRVIRHRLVVAADALIPVYGSPAAAACRIKGTPRVLRGAEMGPELSALGPGIHEIGLDGRAVLALIRDQGGGRYAVVEDVSRFHRIERRVLYALGVAFAMALVGAVALGLFTASRVIAPLTRLANAVAGGAVASRSELHEAKDEIGVLARAFAHHSEQLKRVLERERLFTGDVSHELRTPLTVILGAAELLELRLADRPELQEAARRIRRTVEDASAQVNAMLLLSRAPESIELLEFDFIPVVRAEIERSAPLLENRPVRLLFTTSLAHAFVHARPELAAIAIGNLIRNACQFTEAGEIRVHVEPGKVTVEDTGSGIPEAIRDIVFERHVRAADAPGQGEGLGLAIVRRVAGHLGWQVAVDHLPQGGTRFELAFPAA